jgi:hypothetical protein
MYPDIGRPAAETAHDPPMLFDVDADPSESRPLGAEHAAVAAAITAMKATFEASFTLKAIDPRFGYEWALCCGVGCASAAACVCHCPTPVPLPPM